MVLQSVVGHSQFFSFLIIYTVDRNAWPGDQPAAKLLPTYRTTQTQKKRTQTSMPAVGSNPHSHLSSERRLFMLQTARPLWICTPTPNRITYSPIPIHSHTVGRRWSIQCTCAYSVQKGSPLKVVSREATWSVEQLRTGRRALAAHLRMQWTSRFTLSPLVELNSDMTFLYTAQPALWWRHGWNPHSNLTSTQQVGCTGANNDNRSGILDSVMHGSTWTVSSCALKNRRNCYNSEITHLYKQG
jgi:hypothetical protein